MLSHFKTRINDDKDSGIASLMNFKAEFNAIRNRNMVKEPTFAKQILKTHTKEETRSQNLVSKSRVVI